MANLINLRQFKKRIEREEAAKKAGTNRVRFGLTKAQKKTDKQQAQRASDALDGHRIEDETST